MGRTRARIGFAPLVKAGCVLALAGATAGTATRAPDGPYDGSAPHQSQTVRDIDENTYHTVRIGNQVWTAENLGTTRYRDGSAIPLVSDQPKWGRLSTGAFCDPAAASPGDSARFGLLYNYHAVADGRGLCPEGWHVPDIEEWRHLVAYLGGPQVAGRVMKDTGSSQWKVARPDMNNESGFSALPAGGRGRLGPAGDVGYFATWWSSTSQDSAYAWHFGLYPDRHAIRSNPGHKASGFSVRCVRDS